MNDPRFTDVDKEIFSLGAQNRLMECNPALKAANKDATRNTVQTMRRKQMDETETNYRPELLAKLVIAIGGAVKTQSVIRSIVNAKRQQDIEKIPTRNFLFSMLFIFCNGQRPGTLENMTMTEFQDYELVNGIECIKVAAHKTAKSDGPASVVFALPKLWISLNKLFRYSFIQLPVPCLLCI